MLSLAGMAVGAKLPQVTAQVGDLLFDDELVPGIDGHLPVVAHADLGVRRHRAAVGIGQGDLALARAFQLRGDWRRTRPGAFAKWRSSRPSAWWVQIPTAEGLPS